jgi:hypothetical protein
MRWLVVIAKGGDHAEADVRASTAGRRRCRARAQAGRQLNLLQATALAGAYIGAVASALEVLFGAGGKESDQATTVIRLRASVAYALGASVPPSACG